MDGERNGGGRGTRVLLCDCEGSFTPDPAAIEAASDLVAAPVATHLCGRQNARVAEALRAAEADGGEVIVACAQMAETFAEIAAGLDLPAPLAVDIRDRAGWTDAAGQRLTGPKQAALLAAARLPLPQTPVMDVESGGLCLVIGPTETAAEIATRLAETLSVTVLSTDGEPPLEAPIGWDLARGRVRRASGALGRFELVVDGYAALEPAGRGTQRFGAAADGAATGCDVIVDVTGAPSLFPAPEKRDGYLRADPGDAVGLVRLVAEAKDLVGTFEKPLHIRFEAALCAHKRAGKTGCTRCLSVCPTGAITVAPGDAVEAVTLDPHVCAGCGACAAVCPSGAILADDPPVEPIFRQMRVMADAYAAAGGLTRPGPPRLIVHDEAHGAEMIRLAARHGEGLPADTIPLETRALSAFGHAEALVALALGYAQVTILAGPRADRAVLEAEIALAEAVLEGSASGTGRIALVSPEDPDALAALLREPAPGATGVETIMATGGRRDGVRLAATALSTAGHGGTLPETPIALPAGAPYGTVEVNTDACTLCLACAGLCPTGALMDNPDSPELSFRETACIQCGICATVCPENAITLTPQLDLTEAALKPQVKKAEEPFACIECGVLFGVKSTVERIVAKLENSHAMFTNSDNVRLIKMCDDCRVKVQFNSENNPFAGPARPRTRTTEDYLDKGDA